MRQTLTRALTGIVATVLGLGLTATLPTPADASVKMRDGKIRHAVQIALDQRGDSYIYGAAGPDAFDCSGLLQYSFGRAGISIPRVSGDQANFARPIPRDRMRRGDLMVFNDGGGTYHIGLYLGEHRGQAWMVHSPRPGKSVKRESPWTNGWYPVTLRRK